MSTTERPTRHLLPSLTRIADLDQVPFDVEPLDRAHWATGQYVSVAIAGATARPYQIELRDGRRADVPVCSEYRKWIKSRTPTLQAVGDWADVGEDLHLHLIC